MTSCCNAAARSADGNAASSEALKDSTRRTNQSVCCRFTSYGTGRDSPVTFFTPRASQSSFFKTATMISAMPSVAMAR